jgi:ribosomal-protein-alanine N-acetyltransferase
VPPAPRTAIRPLAPADEAAYLVAAHASRRLHHPWVTPPRDAAGFQRQLARCDGVANFAFVVYLPASGELAGIITLTNIVRGLFCSGYLGYYAFAGFERQGHMRRGLDAVVRHAFTKLQLHRLEANIQPGNAASLALARGCGFRKEGFSPKYLKIGGRWRDHERWAIVRTAGAARRS